MGRGLVGIETPKSHRKRAASLAMRDMQRAAAAQPASRSRMAKRPAYEKRGDN